MKQCRIYAVLSVVLSLYTIGMRADVVEGTLASGDASIQVVKTDGGTYKLAFVYNGRTVPTTNPDNPIYLSVMTRELSGQYSSYELAVDRLTCQGVLTTQRGSVFTVTDVYMAKGNGVIELQRDVKVSNPQAVDKYFNSLFGFCVDEQCTRLTDNEYFIPAVWYKGNFTPNGNLPDGIPGVDDTHFYYREDRITLPLVAFREPDTGFTLTLIHKDSKCNTVINDGLGHFYDAGYQFGAVGIKHENDVIYEHVIFPGSDEDTKGGCGRRFHPVQEGISHKYNVEMCFSTTLDYATAVQGAWNHAFELYAPQIYPVRLQDAYDGLIETLMTYYGANTEMGGIYDAPGWPFEVDLNTFQPRAYNYQMGFVGMQVATGYYIYREGKETGNEDMQAKGEAVLDWWAANALNPQGLPRDWYDPGTNGATGSFRPFGANLRVNTGGMEALIAGWAFAKRNGIDKPAWINACKGYGDWLVRNQNGDGTWYFSYEDRTESAEGKNPPINTNKFLTICAVRYLTELYIATEDERYKTAALEAGNWCYRNIHQRYTYVACVIDNPQTIDSESGLMAMNGFMALYDLTKDAKWLAAAEQAATYTESWVYCMEIPVETDKGDRQTLFPADRSIVGQHLIAIGHSASDLGFAWASFVFYRLYMETGNPHYLHVARLSAHNSKQSMNWDQTIWPGQPKGLQMEAFPVNGLRREGGVYTCLNWNYAAHLDPMFRFKDAFGTPDLEEVEKMSWEERKRLNFIYSQVQSANWGQETEEYNGLATTESQSFSILPNPLWGSNMLEVELPENVDDNCTFEIRDVAGRNILIRHISKADGKKQNIGIERLQTGHYVASLVGASNVFSTKLIVL